MKKPKIALITCYINNYGACLQAYALQKKIEQTTGKNSCIILQYLRIHYGHYEKTRHWENKTLVFKYRCKTLLTKINNISKKVCNKLFSTHFQYAVIPSVDAYNFAKFRKKYLRLTKDIYTLEQIMSGSFGSDFDAYVSGSDQLWNTSFFGGADPVYYLDFVKNNKKKIAYAASIGLNQIPQEYQAEFTRMVEGINHVYMREARGKELVEELTSKKAEHVLDPTLLFGKEFWGELAKNSNVLKRYKIKQPYIFCYIFSTENFAIELIDNIKNITGYQVVAIPFNKQVLERQDIIQIVDAGPEDFVSLIENCEIAITDSFHCTAFSINLNKDFYVFKRDADQKTNNMNSRIYSILDLVELNDRLITTPPQTINKVDFTQANILLNNKRKNDEKLLKEALIESINSK